MQPYKDLIYNMVPNTCGLPGTQSQTAMFIATTPRPPTYAPTPGAQGHGYI